MKQTPLKYTEQKVKSKVEILANQITASALLSHCTQNRSVWTSVYLVVPNHNQSILRISGEKREIKETR